MLLVSIPIGFSGSLQRQSRLSQHRTPTRFNPYRVFWFAATIPISFMPALTLFVSIPIGFSGSLQLIAFSIPQFAVFPCFNPYRVFWFAATGGQEPIPVMCTGFQSLSGFLVRCNNSPTGTGKCIGKEFQSLSGFLVRCNVRYDRREADLNDWVSIPIGFSGSLQPPDDRHISVSYDAVSIPIGFSGSLQQPGSNRPGVPAGEFQSLSGFLVRCNLSSGQAGIQPNPSFNPYRVFWFAATFLPTGRLRFSFRFNPYRVFWFAATSGSLPGPHNLRKMVSIPIGFSGSLQHPGGA